jgi:hypothetical protein
MNAMASSHCKSCGAVIVWAKTQAKKSIPLELTTNETGPGRFYVSTNGTANPIREDATSAAIRDTFEVEIIYQSHFASCPNAKQHRRPTA